MFIVERSENVICSKGSKRSDVYHLETTIVNILVCFSILFYVFLLRFAYSRAGGGFILLAT